ncbi:UDP-N-acetylmuramoyl-L-alanine--D-glutamate ligase [Lentimicrobium sp.]
MNPQSAYTLILGAGESGTGAAMLAKARGINVLVSDAGSIKPEFKRELLARQISFEENGHSHGVLIKADEIIKSPGIPDTAPIIQAAIGAHIPVISEIEFAGRYTTATLAAVTGSNGKTTTTGLLAHLMQAGGLNAIAAGNIGLSFSRAVAEKQHEYYALELSSFQLDGIQDFHAHIAVLLNITPDHLDRYNHSFDAYADAKMRIIRNQSASDAFIWCSDDQTIQHKVKQYKPRAKQYRFSLYSKEEEGAYLENNKIIFNINGEIFTMTLEELALQGKHNIYDSMAAGIAGKLIGLRKESIKQSLADFKNAGHRLEYVANIHGIEFINDSKATNINSTWFALESQYKPVVWIAGGIDKGNDYSKLTELVKHTVKAIVCLGVDNEKLIKAFAHLVPVTETHSMEEAVEKAYTLAGKNEVVLLSPACASFDLFENYEDRGRQFIVAVNQL